MRNSRKVAFTYLVTCLFFATTAAGPALAAPVVVPEETTVYAVLPQEVTSKKRDTNAGDVISARVWRDVVVDGEVVIAEGAEMKLRVSHVKKARFLGRKGRLELEAVSVTAVDGRELPLAGLYYRTGKGRKAVTGTLAVVVAWPFLFLKGKNARVPEGTVFGAYVLEDTAVTPWPEQAAL